MNPQQLSLHTTTVPIIVHDKLYIPRSPELSNVLDELRSKFTHTNPMFHKLESMGKWTGNVERDIEMWQNLVHPKMGECLAVPRGATNVIRSTFAEYEIAPKFIDERLSLPPVTGWVNNVELRPDQAKLVEILLRKENCLIRSPTASGKCLHPDTPVLLYNGETKRAEDVQVGDLLMGPDSRPRTVLSTSVGFGILYKIIPTAGMSWICNEDHILTLYDRLVDPEIFDIPLMHVRRIIGNNTEHQYGLVRTEGQTNISFKIRHAGIGKYVGWTLDGDGRYLLGDFTVTHNTESALKAIEYMLVKSGPVLVIVWESGLLRQWVERAAKRFGLHPSQIGTIGLGKKPNIQPITIAMEQTLYKGVQRYTGLFGGVVCDEVQRFAAKSFRHVIGNFPARYRIGISADETRKDGMEGLTYDLFGEVAGEIEKAHLISEGKIHDIIVRIVPTEFNYFEKFGHEMVQWLDIPAKHKNYKVLIDRLCSNEARNNLIMQFMTPALGTGHYALVIVQRVNHAHHFQNELREADFSTGLMLGGTGASAVNFNTTLDNLNAGTVRVGIGTIQKIGQALDIPRIDREFVVMPLAGNKQQLEQAAGRLRRTFPGKTDAILYYFWDKHVFPFHRRMIKKLYPQTFIWNGKEFVNA